MGAPPGFHVWAPFANLCGARDRAQPDLSLSSGVSSPLCSLLCKNPRFSLCEDGGNIGGSRVHFPSTPGKYLADLRSRANSQQYSSIYEDQRPKIEDIERSDGKKSA